MYGDYCDGCEKKLECVESCKYGTLGAVRVAAVAQLPDAGLTTAADSSRPGGRWATPSLLQHSPVAQKLALPLSPPQQSGKVKTFHRTVLQ